MKEVVSVEVEDVVEVATMEVIEVTTIMMVEEEEIISMFIVNTKTKYNVISTRKWSQRS